MSSIEQNARTPKELSRIYNDRVVENIKKLLVSQKISQNALVDILRNHGLDMNQGTLSKYLSGTAEVQFSVIVKICEVFDISITDFVSERFLYLDMDISTDKQVVEESLEQADPKDTVLYIPKLGNKFISNSDDLDFRGWVQSYWIYFFPTLSNVQEVLKGRLVLSKSEVSGVCEACLTLDTNHTNRDGTPIVKKYTGCAIISTSVHSLYIILSSEEEGELCMLNMRHFFIRHQNLDCRMASVLTNSAGEGHVPTVHRALISREDIRDKDLALILPQLHLNSSDIVIRESALKELSEKSEEYGKLVDHLTHLVEAERVFFFKEDYVRSNAFQFLKDKKYTCVFMSEVRDLAYKMRYNKVSNKVDENIHTLLRNLGYYASVGED